MRIASSSGSGSARSVLLSAARPELCASTRPPPNTDVAVGRAAGANASTGGGSSISGGSRISGGSSTSEAWNGSGGSSTSEAWNGSGASRISGASNAAGSRGGASTGSYAGGSYAGARFVRDRFRCVRGGLERGERGGFARRYRFAESHGRRLGRGLGFEATVRAGERVELRVERGVKPGVCPGSCLQASSRRRRPRAAGRRADGRWDRWAPLPAGPRRAAPRTSRDQGQRRLVLRACARRREVG